MFGEIAYKNFNINYSRDIFLTVATIITPPDILSKIIVFVEISIVYGFLSFIISQFKSINTGKYKKLIIVMLCILSITITNSINVFLIRIQNNDLRTEQS